MFVALVQSFALIFYGFFIVLAISIWSSVSWFGLICVLLAFACKIYIGTFPIYLVAHLCSFGIFSDVATHWVLVVVNSTEGVVQRWCPPRVSEACAPVFSFIRHVYSSPLLVKVSLVLGWIIQVSLGTFFIIVGKTIRSPIFMVVAFLSIMTLLGYVNIFGVIQDATFPPLLSWTVRNFELVVAFSHNVVFQYRSGRRFRRGALALLVMWLVNVAHYSGLLVSRHRITEQRITRAKVLRSMSVAFARYVDSLRLPQIVRSAAEAGFTAAEADQIENNLDAYLDWLRSIGYPVAPEIVESEAMPIAGGKYDANWLITGSSWRIHAPQLAAFAQPEFRKFQHLVEEYRPTMSYATLDNQLASISRYFANPSVDFPEPSDTLDIVWDIVKLIYQNSRILPAAYIYKQWNKKFNVGVYATSSKRNRMGGLRKLPRREWIQRVGGPSAAISLFENFAKFALAFDTHAQFFTKVEWLKPSKWMNDVVRTPVAAMLPEYVVQMMVSGDANKRFLWQHTPIKLGMPLKAGTFHQLWERHSRFSRHFAGDCTAFDSTIVGPVMRLIKAVRVKGFEAHKDYAQIEKVMDRIYEVIEHGRLVSANSGNVYKKGTGLMTGHASTSPDNSLVMVALYLVAWKTLTGRSAAEFRAMNELSVYGDDHVLSISDLAPPVWNWNNITRVMASWGVTMREEVPSGGVGLRLEQVPFLKKWCRTPTSKDVEDLKSAFGDDTVVPRFITVHDHKALVGKAIAPMTNRNPLYRAKRIQSFMYLCAHDRDAYDMLHTGLEHAFNRYPNIRAQIGRYTPSYNRVLQVWYTSNVPIDVIDEEDESVLVDGSEAIVLYGEVTMLERLFSLLSTVPDIVNPALRNIGPIEYMMKTFAPLLSWPKALIAHTHDIASKGHLEALVSNSSYDWIAKIVPFSNRANYTTLVLRHWVYMALQQSKSYSFAFYVTGFFSKLISLNFIINGYVAQSRPKFAISYWNFFLVVALNWFNVPSIPGFENFIKACKMPDFVGLVDDLWSSLIANILHRIPASFADLANAFPHHLKMAVSAPTGSGKSTAMIYMLSQIHDGRIFVIEPRVNLVTGIATWLNTQYPWVVGYIHGDGRENPDARVVFVTHGWFLAAHQSLLGQGHLFVLDEAHVDEIPQKLCLQLLKEVEEKVIFASATLPPLPDITRVDLTVSNTFSYEVTQTTIPTADVYGAYLVKCLEVSRGVNPWFKHLVFVDSFDEMDYLMRHLPGKCGSVSGRGVNIHDDDMWIVATSAADVGITIPSVDVVITRSWARAMGPRGLGPYPLPEHTIKQRAGRTGRTNNGFVFVVRPQEANFLFDGLSTSSLQEECMARLVFGMRIPRNIATRVGITEDSDMFYNTLWNIETSHASRYPTGYQDISLRYPLNAIFLSTVFREFRDMLDEYEPEDHDGLWDRLAVLLNQVITAFATGVRIPEEQRTALKVDEGHEVSVYHYLLDPKWDDLLGDWRVEDWYREVMTREGTYPRWSYEHVQTRFPIIYENVE